MNQGKLKGLNDFKKSFGGELYPFYRGQLIVKPLLKAGRDLIQLTIGKK
jgi:hypothetical protein